MHAAISNNTKQDDGKITNVKTSQGESAPQPPMMEVDNIIKRLLSERVLNPHGPLINVLTGPEIRNLCLMAQQIFKNQPMLLELEAPVNICGDIHGQYYDLIKIFKCCGFPPDDNYLFLGDYVDRGRQSIETICLLLAYKIKYPYNFFILRGNHESPNISRVYGFYEECKKRYTIKLWRTFLDVFTYLPVAAIVEDRIFCSHGGLSPDLSSMEDILKLERQTEIPSEGLVCDLLWSDPEPGIDGYGPNDRGVSYTFGENVVEYFLQEHDLDLICRAHMVVQDGYEFFANRKLVTVFSAPHYCGQFDNAAAMLRVDRDLKCAFTVFKPKRSIASLQGLKRETSVDNDLENEFEDVSLVED